MEESIGARVKRKREFKRNPGKKSRRPRKRLTVIKNETLPDDILRIIFTMINSTLKNRSSVLLTCKKWNQIGISCMDPSIEDNMLIIHQSGIGNIETVEKLLKDERIDPSACGNEAIRRAAKGNHDKVVELLLTKEKVDPEMVHPMQKSNYSYANTIDSMIDYLQFSASSSEIKSELIDETNRDYNFVFSQHTDAICTAATLGHIKVINKIMTSQKYMNNICLRCHIENFAIFRAANNKKWDMVLEFLKLDKKIDPTKRNNGILFRIYHDPNFTYSQSHCDDLSQELVLKKLLDYPQTFASGLPYYVSPKDSSFRQLWKKKKSELKIWSKP